MHKEAIIRNSYLSFLAISTTNIGSNSATAAVTINDLPLPEINRDPFFCPQGLLI